LVTKEQSETLTTKETLSSGGKEVALGGGESEDEAKPAKKVGVIRLVNAWIPHRSAATPCPPYSPPHHVSQHVSIAASPIPPLRNFRAS